MRAYLPVLLSVLMAGQLVAQSTDSEAEVFFPRTSADDSSEVNDTDRAVSPAGGSTFVMFTGYGVVLAVLGVGVFFALKRGGWRNVMKRSDGRLQVSETRMLGNRQFLMVVEYEESRLLVGVSPGRIELLTPLGPTLSNLEALPEGFMAGAKGG
jgi:flagellar biogenesis protein FliO